MSDSQEMIALQNPPPSIKWAEKQASAEREDVRQSGAVNPLTSSADSLMSYPSLSQANWKLGLIQVHFSHNQPNS